MNRFELTLRIGHNLIKQVIVRTNDLFAIKSIVQKYNVKLIGVKPL